MRTARFLSILALTLVACALDGPVRPAAAQYHDARLIPGGLLRIGFEPHYRNYDQRFALGTPGVPDGTPELLGTDLTADTVGTNLFPALSPTEMALRVITDDAGYRMNVGSFRTVLDRDIRRFPLTLAYGLTDRITLSAYIPIVTHRAQVDFAFDSTDANVGWNEALAARSTAGAAQAAALVGQFQTAIGELESQLAGGGFGCPTSPMCAEAQATLDRGRALLSGLMVLTQQDPSEHNLPTLAPLAGSATGMALTAEIAAVAAELQALGTSPITATFPLPTQELTSGDIDNLLTNPDFGYRARSLSFIRGTSFGDIELGMRIGVIQHHAVRAALDASVRLPTGRNDLPDHFVDLGTGDRQTDIVLGAQVALEPGSVVGLVVSGYYNLQLPHQLVRRVAPPDMPIVPFVNQVLVERNLGDEITLNAFPTLRLNPSFTVYAVATYYRKQRDRFAAGTGVSPDDVPNDIALLEQETRMESMALGGGITFRSDYDAEAGRMPIEAGVSYRSTFSGSGGMTPKANDLRFYLRLYLRPF